MDGLVYFPKVPFFNHKVSIGLYHIKGYWRIHQNLIKEIPSMLAFGAYVLVVQV